MSPSTPVKSRTAEKAPRKRALLFDLESIAFNGRQIVFDTLKDTLREKDIQLTPVLFAKYCLQSSPKVYMPKLLAAVDKKRLSADNLLAAFQEVLKKALTADKKPAPGLLKCLSDVGKRNMLVGALTCLDSESAKQVLTVLGVADSVSHVTSYSREERNYPSADAWLRLAKSLGAPPPLCVAVCTCAFSCKAALSSGMRCIVIPDDFTSFQDFGGADCVAQTLEDREVSDLIAMMAP